MTPFFLILSSTIKHMLFTINREHMVTSKEERRKKAEMAVPGELNVITPCYPKSERLDSAYPLAKMNSFRNSGAVFIGVKSPSVKSGSLVNIRRLEAYITLYNINIKQHL